jgi:hypothetical protein
MSDNDPTAAERMKRMRQRKKEQARLSNDPVANFLTNVVTAADEAGEAGKAEAWHRRTASAATRYLGLMDGSSKAPDDGMVWRIALIFGGKDVPDVMDLVRQWLAEHFSDYRERTKGTATIHELSPEGEEAEKTLLWAEDLRTKGEWSSPVVNEALRAAASLIRERDQHVTTEEYDDFVTYMHTLAWDRYFENGCQPISAVDYAW